MCCLQSPIRSRGRLPVGLGSSNKIPVPVKSIVSLYSIGSSKVPLNLSLGEKSARQNISGLGESVFFESTPRQSAHVSTAVCGYPADSQDHQIGSTGFYHGNSAHREEERELCNCIEHQVE